MGSMSEISIIVGSRPTFVSDYHLYYLDAIDGTQLVEHDKYYSYLANDQEIPEEQAKKTVEYWDATLASRGIPGGR